MKVLIVSQYFWPENFRINDLALNLKSRGHEVTVLTGWPNYPDGNIYPIYKDNKKKYSKYHGIHVVRVPLIPRGQTTTRLFLNYASFVLSASILGPVKLAGIKFDCIFVYEPSPVTVGLPAILLKYIKDAPLAFWVLDLWPETLTAVGVVKSKILINIVGGLVRFIYKHTDLLLVQSKSFIKGVSVYCNDISKIKYFPSWAEDIFTQESTKPPVEFVDNGESFRVMFAGNIGDAQDFLSILAAAEFLKDFTSVKWMIVGDGRMAEWVRQEIRVRGLDKNIIMLGRFPLSEMPTLYASADALLVTLKSTEIFSMTIPGKLQTYLAAGKPILGMIDGEGANIISESRAGFACAAGNAKGLSEIIIKMARLSEHERVIMGQLGRLYYKKEFQKDTLIDRLESWLLEMR